jgi:hypothetical protein
MRRIAVAESGSPAPPGAAGAARPVVTLNLAKKGIYVSMPGGVFGFPMENRHNKVRPAR